jgi:23S rRNA (uracil1939-C5)-methyltransferase
MVRKPICNLFQRCGGCSYLDREYNEQLQLKVKIVNDIFHSLKIRFLPELKIFFKNEFFYRNRMDFAFSNLGLGLKGKDKFFVFVKVDKCFIASEKINFLLDEINKWFNENKEKLDVFDINKRKGTLKYAVIRASFFTDSTTVTFILNRDAEKLQEQKNFLLEFCKNLKSENILFGYVGFNSGVSVTENYEVIKGSDFMFENLMGIKFFYHSQGFFQNNSIGILDIMTYLKENITEKYELLFDLYGGVGTFGIYLSEMADKVIIADSNELSLTCAEKNIKENKILNAKTVKFLDNAPEKYFTEINNKKVIFVVDPPRSGIHGKTIEFIKKVAPEKILYVSCNPETLARDCLILFEKYNLQDIKIFDLFPQTRHIETVAILKRK